MTRAFDIENRGGVIGVLENVGCSLENRRRAGAGYRVRPLPCVQRKGVEIVCPDLGHQLLPACLLPDIRWNDFLCLEPGCFHDFGASGSIWAMDRQLRTDGSLLRRQVCQADVSFEAG